MRTYMIFPRPLAVETGPVGQLNYKTITRNSFDGTCSLSLRCLLFLPKGLLGGANPLLKKSLAGDEES